MQRLVIFLFATLVLATGCATNPVTGKSELRFISEAQEVSLGEQHYLPSRQMQGGDYVVEPSITEYVQGVGNRLAAQSDRPLPYEFSVLNSSVPNAWALPGGKIAINRGLLMELGSEAELAAVMGHEIVHAAARHGAKSQERGMLLQGAMLAVQLSARDNDYANLLVGGAAVGAQLVTTKYGRDAELESDYYGMQYMAKSGYNPSAAVDLQQTFVRLSEGRKTDWLSGLFASHPPSQLRVDTNRETAASLGDVGDFGRERYQAAMAPLRKSKPAYDAYDEGVEALRGGNASAARSLAQRALSIEPREAKFHELLGDVEAKGRNTNAALAHYSDAIQRNPGFFQPYLKSGILKERSGNLAAAQQDLERSIQLLPTATAYYSLGNIARQSGHSAKAVDYYKVAAGSDSDVGRQATVELVELDLPNNPGQYIQTGVQLDERGMVVAMVANRAPLAVTNIEGFVVVMDPTGRQVVANEAFRIRDVLAPNQTGGVRTGLGPVTDSNQLSRVRIELRGAQVAR